MPLIISCEKDDIVLSYGDYNVTESEFTYYLAMYKGRFDKVYTDFEDTKEYYSTVIDENGLTREKFLFNMAVDSVKMTLAACVIFDEYGLILSDSTIDAVDEFIDSLIYDYANGDEKALEEELAQFGIDLKTLREIYLRDEKVAALLEFLYGSGGEIGISDEDRMNFILENYVRVCHIYVNTKYKYSTDEDGYLIYTSDGYAQTEPLSMEELKTKNALVSAIDESLAEGGDYVEIYKALSEDKYYENGYYFTRSSNFITEVIDASFSLEVGEWVKFESAYGVHYVKRLEMDDSPWTNDANSDFFSSLDDTIASTFYTEIIDREKENVGENESVLKKFSLIDSPTNYRF